MYRREALNAISASALTASALAALTALTIAPVAALAQKTASGWPSKPIRLVVPFAAGGPADVLARFITAKMAVDLGQTIVLDNKGGAGGTLGGADIARSPPDGYNLLFSSTGALVIFPVLAQSMPYDADRDLMAVGNAFITPGVLVVSGKSRFNKLSDLIADAKANPGKLNFASAGSGTTTQFGVELLKRDAGIFITHIPYRGAAPALTDVIAGTADMAMPDVPAALQFIRGGQLKALAVAAPTRTPTLPEVPTMGELGYKDVISGTWYGFMAPTRTPADIVARLNASMNQALKSPDTVAFMAAQGVTALGGTPAETDSFIRSEARKWQTLARAIGAKLD